MSWLGQKCTLEFWRVQNQLERNRDSHLIELRKLFRSFKHVDVKLLVIPAAAIVHTRSLKRRWAFKMVLS